MRPPKAQADSVVELEVEPDEFGPGQCYFDRFATGHVFEREPRLRTGGMDRADLSNDSSRTRHVARNRDVMRAHVNVPIAHERRRTG